MPDVTPSRRRHRDHSLSMTEREMVPVALYSKREIIIPAKDKVVIDVFSPNRKGTADETGQYRKW